MSNWFSNRARIKNALIAGSGGAIGGLIAVFVINHCYPEDPLTYLVVIGGFVGAFTGGMYGFKDEEP